MTAWLPLGAAATEILRSRESAHHGPNFSSVRLSAEARCGLAGARQRTGIVGGEARSFRRACGSWLRHFRAMANDYCGIALSGRDPRDSLSCCTFRATLTESKSALGYRPSVTDDPFAMEFQRGAQMERHERGRPRRPPCKQPLLNIGRQSLLHRAWGAGAEESGANSCHFYRRIGIRIVDVLISTLPESFARSFRVRPKVNCLGAEIPSTPSRQWPTVDRTGTRRADL